MAEERLQRRLAAILSADVVGYSRLMGIDEAGTLARLKALRRDLIDPNIAAHSGRIVKLMGDGVLVEFGSAVDAVACAIEIQKQRSRARCRRCRSQSDPVPHRHQCRRHHHRRRRYFWRWRQHRGADRKRRCARRHLAFGGRLAAGAGQGGGQLRR